MNDDLRDLLAPDYMTALRSYHAFDENVWRPLAVLLEAAAPLASGVPRLQAAYDRLAADIEALEARKVEAEAEARQALEALDVVREQRRQEDGTIAAQRAEAERVWLAKEDDLKARIHTLRKELDALQTKIRAI